jgi:hypothetical protein
MPPLFQTQHISKVGLYVESMAEAIPDLAHPQLSYFIIYYIRVIALLGYTVDQKIQQPPSLSTR